MQPTQTHTNLFRAIHGPESRLARRALLPDALNLFLKPKYHCLWQVYVSANINLLFMCMLVA